MDGKLVRNVLIKGLLLFLLCNVLFAALDPIPALGRLSAYNVLFPGRKRLPYGDNPSKAYNLSLYQLDAMFASHEISAKPKTANEYRILFVGDSSVWGFLLKPGETNSAHTNYAQLTAGDGRVVRAYNFGYPTVSLMKDLLILEYGMRYQPDLIVWFVTLEGFPYDKQLSSPLVQNNAEAVQRLIYTYHLRFDPQDNSLVHADFWQQTIVGQRRSLADLLRLQLYGVLWAATGVDQEYPKTYTLRQEDLSADLTFHKLQPPHLKTEDLSFDVLKAGMQVAGDVPVVLVNEPIFISRGVNSDLRYNAMYPRWAYDEYRRILAQECEANAWFCIDLWDTVPAGEFTNTAIHVTPSGASELAVVPVQFLQLSLELMTRISEQIK